MRELYEETGVTLDYLGETPDWMTYEFPPYDGPPHRLAFSAASGRNGSRSASPATSARSRCTDWRNGQEPEFDAWRWEPLANVAALVVPFRREVYAGGGAGICAVCRL